MILKLISSHKSVFYDLYILEMINENKTKLVVNTINLKLLGYRDIYN